MRRPVQDPLPTVRWASTVTLTVARRPLTNGNVRLSGGGMVQIPAAGLTLNTGNSGANGLNTGSDLTVDRWRYVYLYDNAGTAAVTMDNTDPDTGPSAGVLSGVNYRYIAPVYITTASVIEPFYLQDGHWSYTRASNVAQAVYDWNNSIGANTWTTSADMFAVYALPTTAGEVQLGSAARTAAGNFKRVALVADSSQPSYTPYEPSPGGNYAFTFTQWQELNGMQTVRVWLPVIDGNLYVYHHTSSAIPGTVQVMGFNDKLLKR